MGLLMLVWACSILTVSGCRYVPASDGSREPTVPLNRPSDLAADSQTAAVTSLFGIKDLEQASPGQRVTILGTAAAIKRYNSGSALFNLDDGTGMMTVFIPKNSGIDLLCLSTGDEYYVAGILQDYQGTLELVPEHPDSLIHAGICNFSEVTVFSVIDGDTVHIRYTNGREEKVRIIGVDSPELAREGMTAEPFAEEAKAYAEDILLGRTVYLEQDYSDLDRYGRQLRYIWLALPDEITADTILPDNYSALLLQKGYADFIVVGDDNKYREVLAECEENAQKDLSGIWSD